MNEVLILIDKEGKAIYWHEPEAGFVPDSSALWSAIWDNRHRIRGIAHSHPAGCRWYSGTDFTTFKAIEAGLGQKLEWWIVTDFEIARYVWYGPTESYVEEPVLPGDIALYDQWISEVRQKSGYK